MSEDAGPEHTAKHELTEWLHKHGIGVYWEETNPWNYPTFCSHGTGDKPDMILRTDELSLVVEFKSGQSVGELYDATLQTHRYWQQVCTGNMRLTIHSNPVSVDGVLTASGGSGEGRLFPSYAEVKTSYESHDEGRKWCSRANILPRNEYRMTEQHVRILWRLSKQDDITIDEPPYIGALLSTSIDDENHPRPAVLWNEGDQNQNWEVIV
ncbi:hypothetical protein OSG_eHP9_00140 [environmental Halophage eHP-9]|jgi:hypothetical protein|nr:hypothetical protein OSG_eHP9_00140 [environmental Halophage eHP-9]